MEHRPLGRSGLTVPVIGMGTWQTFDVRDPAQVRAVTDAAIAGGATFFDSSPMYGRAERVLAETLDGRRPSVLIATKVWAGTFREGREQIRRALDWYGGVVDLYQIHNLVGWREYLPYLEELRAAGANAGARVQDYTAAALAPIARIGRGGPWSRGQRTANPGRREAVGRP